MSLIREGKIWKFADDINTDLIFPNRAMRAPLEEQFKLVFSANRPNWVDMVTPGDLIIGGKNFGMGSGRPVGRLLSECGIVGLVAESVNGLCMRNCVNAGFPALSAPGVASIFEEGQHARINYASGLIENLDRPGITKQTTGLPDLFLEMIKTGGTLQMLIAEGFIEPEPFKSSSA